MTQKQLILGAFEELTPSFISNGWPHQRSDPAGFATLGYWQALARQLDAAGFDFLFFADALGYPMHEETAPDGSSHFTIPEVVVREAVQFPVHDPLTIVSGLAATVDRLGFVVTASTTAEHPFLLARRFASLDHLTGGRIGWNVVTSDMQTALVRLLGHPDVTPHDQRYARADEFVDLTLKLWEGGWSDDPLVVDKSSRVFTDPAKVHRVTHEGRYFSLDGLFPVSPSVQRTPTLFQAGSSPSGREFASRIAECVFIQERDPVKAAATVRDIRDRVERRGRGRDSVKIINSISVIVGATDAEAADARRALTAAPSREAMAALFLGWSGVNLLGLDPDAPVDSLTTEVGQTTLAMYQGQGLTVGDVLDALAETLGGTKITGTADHVAEAIGKLAADTDVDGFLIEHSYGGLASYAEFIDEVMPRLRERGLLPAEPRGGSLRERLTGSPTPRLGPEHPGAAFRPAY
ncbi:NtaA/DmoA family FMN-dependent monooxygenase [Subtercola boreus]|uniref:NtaA/DmoA family FMN-dependent monooxygenase n=1 Tax=Subtercola boreus TaxID=120213 RepID=UPI00116FB97D|nr:NtaA/DmoA family FMN-dependent monooxygenase [Subtercola boreus]TQL53259.1 FMN-dependent oxidoreductase (nitrilotriacetate monooxygenase family) [Subtercola boreus]